MTWTRRARATSSAKGNNRRADALILCLRGYGNSRQYPAGRPEYNLMGADLSFSLRARDPDRFWYRTGSQQIRLKRVESLQPVLATSS